MKGGLSHEIRFARWLRQHGMGAEPVRYARPEAGGDVAAHRLLPAAAPRGRVVAAHGTGNDALFPQLGLFKALLHAGYEVFAFDLDGHGSRSTTRLDPNTAPSAVGAAVRAAEANRPPLPLHLLGHSLGAALVLHSLAHDPWAARVHSAVAISAPLRLRVTLRAALAELLGFASRRTWSEREHYGIPGLVPALGPWKREQFPVRLAERHGRFGYVRVAATLLQRLHLADAAARVAAPVLLVYGERDRLVPPEQGETLAGRLPAACLLRVAGTTHFNTPFSEPALTAVVEWLHTAAARTVRVGSHAAHANAPPTH